MSQFGPTPSVTPAMPLVRFLHAHNTVDYVNPSATAFIPAGTVIVQGSLLGFAVADIPPGGMGALYVQGVSWWPKTNTDVVAAGTPMYWDATNQVATATAGSNTLIGKSVMAAANGEYFVQIRMTQ